MGKGSQLTRDDWLRIAIAAVVVGFFATVLSGRFHDADDLLRQLQVRAWLAGQSWYDVTQYRIDPPAGVAMHWSRWVDIPLALAILIARPFTDSAGAEAFALTVVPLVTLFIMVALVYANARLLFGRTAATFAALLVMAAPAALLQIHPARIDHHGWQIVLALAGLRCLLSTSPKADWLLGGLLALWLAISLEGLPLTAAYLGVLGLGWVLGKAAPERLVRAIAALFAVSVGLWLVTHRLESASFRVWCDVLTPVHLAALGLAAAGTLATWRLTPGAGLRPAIGLAASGLVAGALILAIAPECRAGAFAQLDPLVARLWLGRVGEAQPIWGQPAATAVMLIGPAVIGLLVLAFRWRSAAPDQRLPFAAYFLILLAATVLAAGLSRAASAAAALALPAVGWQLADWLERAAQSKRLVTKLALVGAIMLTIMPWLPIAIFNRAAHAQEPAADDPRAACDATAIAPVLAQLPPGTVFAPIDLGPDLLMVSDKTIVASAHHRGVAGMKWTIQTFEGSPDAAGRSLRDRQIAYVAVCPGQNEANYYRKDAPHGFMASLLADRQPSWLTPVPTPAGSGIRLWRVAR